MSERSSSDLQIVLDITRIASEETSLEQRAQALVEPLRRVVPFRALWISLLDPESRKQPPLVSTGYPDELVRYAGGPDGVAEIEKLGLHRTPGAVRIADLPTPLRNLPSWADYLAPAGFRNGLIAGLFSRDGRYLGVLGLHTDSATHPTSAARDLISQLTPTIAHAVDPMRVLTSAVGVVHGVTAGVVVTRAGKVVALPGVPGHPMLSEHAPVLVVAARLLAARSVHATFLCPTSTRDSTAYVRITVIGSTGRLPNHLAGAVVMSARTEATETADLVRPEAELLGMLVEDRPLSRIADALSIDGRTLAGHLTTLEHKLGAPSREAAVLRAFRRGLYVPAEITRRFAERPDLFRGGVDIGRTTN